jgi:hypothetical protein
MSEAGMVSMGTNNWPIDSWQYPVPDGISAWNWCRHLMFHPDIAPERPQGYIMQLTFITRRLSDET